MHSYQRAAGPGAGCRAALQAAAMPAGSSHSFYLLPYLSQQHSALKATSQSPLHVHYTSRSCNVMVEAVVGWDNATWWLRGTAWLMGLLWHSLAPQSLPHLSVQHSAHLNHCPNVTQLQQYPAHILQLRHFRTTHAPPVKFPPTPWNHVSHQCHMHASNTHVLMPICLQASQPKDKLA